MRPCATVVLLCFALIASAGCTSSPDEDAREGEAAPTTTDISHPPTTSPLDSSRIAETAAPFAETPDLVVGKGDEADDVAIHPDGYVIGVSKNSKGGLEVYDLEANRLQWVELGETNNVDLRGNMVVSSNRSNEAVDVLSFEDGELSHVRSFPVPFDPYGICLYRDTVVVTANGAADVAQYSLAGELLRRFPDIGSQSEGCVADDERGVLYVAEEEKGIWKFDAVPDASPRGTLIDGVGDHLEADVEGLTLAGPFLIASSQGDSTYAVYRKDEYIASFSIPETDEVDGTRGTDGLAADPGLDLLVVHDRKNADGRTSNYKYVRLSDIFRG
jgi:3-phytase